MSEGGQHGPVLKECTACWWRDRGVDSQPHGRGDRSTLPAWPPPRSTRVPPSHWLEQAEEGVWSRDPRTQPV